MSTDSYDCRITCNNPDIPCDEKNIVWKAAKAFFDATGLAAEIAVDIEKHVPLMGGMGGSSVDGAGTLVALNELFGKNSMLKHCVLSVIKSVQMFLSALKAAHFTA